MALAPKIIIVTGPTASGKSGVALSIAQKQGGVIINADSQQVYRELRVLTARPSAQDEALAPHRLYGTLPGSEHCSAGKWLNLARMEIDWALSQGMVPVVTGGTGLYIKALMEGIAEIPDIAPEVRQQAENDYGAMGREAFAGRLKYVDPEFFTRLKVYDRQRLIRAYAVWLGTGKALSYWHGQGGKPPYPEDYFKLYQMDIDRNALYRNCNMRLAQMVEQGAVDEVKDLLSLGILDSLPVMKSVGVKEFGAYLRQEISLQEALDKARQATRNYAKRQLTWCRNQLKGAAMLPAGAKL